MTTPMPVDGNNKAKSAPDGVSASPAGSQSEVHGRSPEGESDGGAYPNPHTGKTPTSGSVMGHGGQTEIDYHGGGQSGDNAGGAANATTGSSDAGDSEDDRSPWAAPVYEPHEVTAGGRTFGVIETNGVAQAEATAKVGTDAAYEREQESPGAG